MQTFACTAENISKSHRGFTSLCSSCKNNNINVTVFAVTQTAVKRIHLVK